MKKFLLIFKIIEIYNHLLFKIMDKNFLLLKLISGCEKRNFKIFPKTTNRIRSLIQTIKTSSKFTLAFKWILLLYKGKNLLILYFIWRSKFYSALLQVVPKLQVLLKFGIYISLFEVIHNPYCTRKQIHFLRLLWNFFVIY